MIPINQESNKEILRSILEEKLEYLTKDVIILMDADRTLCNIDTSRILTDMAKIDFSKIKKGFQKHGYTYNGFQNMALTYSQLSIEEYLKYSEETASQVNLYPGVINCINGARDFADIIIVTSGVKGIWDFILKKTGINEVFLIGGTHTEIDTYIIGREEKGMITNYFNDIGKTTIAIGDSDVDSLMLKNANNAIIVLNHRNNADLLPHLFYHPSLFQITYKDYFHENIRKIKYHSFWYDLKRHNVL